MGNYLISDNGPWRLRCDIPSSLETECQHWMDSILGLDDGGTLDEQWYKAFITTKFKINGRSHFQIYPVRVTRVHNNMVVFFKLND